MKHNFIKYSYSYTFWAHMVFIRLAFGTH